MKILMITYNPIGRGTYIRAYELAKNLVNLGQEVTLLASSNHQNKNIVHRKINGVQVVTSRSFLGGPFKSGYDPLEVISRIKWIKKQYTFDIVQGFESRPTVIYPALKLKKIGIPLVLDWCDWYGSGGSIEERPNSITRALLRPLEDYYENHFRLQANATTVICSTLMKKAIASGINPDSILLLPNGLNIDGLESHPLKEARSYFGIPLSAFVIGYVGSLFHSDANLMKRAFLAISKEIPNAHLLHLGLSNYTIKEMEIDSENITITGRVSEREIQLGLAACDLCWLPMTDSNANKGRSPLKFSSYLTAGKPVVITDVGDLPRYIAQNNAGLVCSPSSMALSDAVQKLVESPNLLTKMANNGKVLSQRSDYSWFAQANRLLQIYQQVLGESTEF